MPHAITEKFRAILAIDLGASYTKLAWRPAWTPQRNGSFAEFKQSSQSLKIADAYHVPSIVLDPGRGRPWQFGNDAAKSKPGTAGKVYRNWKSVLFSETPKERELAAAIEAATGFLEWLFKCARESNAGPKKDFEDAILRLCVPALSDRCRRNGIKRLTESVIAAGWDPDRLKFESEPKANLIGLGTAGRNSAYIHEQHGHEVNYGEIYARPMLQAARSLIFSPQSSGTCNPICFGIVDVGAFTTDVGVCSVNRFGDVTVNDSNQHSFDHGVVLLDNALRELIIDSGADLSQLSDREFQELKVDIYAGKAFNSVIGRLPLRLRAGCLTEKIEEFANEAARLCRTHLHECRWYTLTGGGVEIPVIAASLHREFGRELRNVRDFFPDFGDQRLATAIGGASIILDAGTNTSVPHRSNEPSTVPIVGKPCSCGGANKNCTKCDGKGWISGAPSSAIIESRLKVERQPAATFSQITASKQEKHLPTNAQTLEGKRAIPSKRVVPDKHLEPTDATAPLDFQAIQNAWDEPKALSEFTLSGWMGKLVFDAAIHQDKQLKLLGEQCSTVDGKAAWLRLLCLGTCLGVRHRSPKRTVQNFWREKLEDVWGAFIPDNLRSPEQANYNKKLDEVFVKAIHRQFNDINASGEDAELWRRFFYDFRKLHHFVYRNDFPETILEVATQHRTTASSLINFMKSGQLPGNQGRWQGVLGQSMTAPLFFIVRELRRIGVIDAKFDPIAYYMNGKARSVGSRLNWIEAKPGIAYNVEALTEFSIQCHQKGQIEAPQLVGHFDIPFQWYAHNNM